MRTLMLIKPDAVHRDLVGKIISRVEEKGLTVIAIKVTMPGRALAALHYEQHKDQEWYSAAVETLTHKPVVALVIAGPDAVFVVRKMIGEDSNCRLCSPGTIRGDFGLSRRLTVVHGSDSEETARREMALWFRDEEIFPYEKSTFEWTRTSIDPQD